MENEYYFLAHTGRQSSHERTKAITSTNSFITFTEYEKTMNINVHLWILKCLKKMKKEVNELVSGDVNIINISRFNLLLKKKIIESNIDSIIKILKEVINPSSKLSIRDQFILAEYNNYNKLGKMKKYNFLDIFIMESINYFHINRYPKKNACKFLSVDYNKKELIGIIMDSISIFTEDVNLIAYKEIKNEEIKKYYQTIYDYFKKGISLFQIFQNYTNIDIKLYKMGQTMPNLRFQFNGIFPHTTKSLVHKMGLYQLTEENYEDIMNVRIIDNEDERESILQKIRELKKSIILKNSIFPKEEDCEPEVIGKTKDVILCQSNMQTLLNFINVSGINNSVFYLFGCSIQPISKKQTDKLDKMIKLSRMMSVMGQEDFSTMRERVNTAFGEDVIDDEGNIMLVFEDDGEKEPTEMKYLKYKMKYLLLKKYINKS